MGSFSDFSRQKDTYQCGVFAVKDARELNRERGTLAEFSSTHKPTLYSVGETYKLPSKYLKNMQSKEFSKHILKHHGKDVVTRTGLTLEDVHNKHNVSGYVRHFSQKYHEAVRSMLEKNQSTPGIIRDAVEKYDAAKMTPERLETMYGPEAVTNQAIQGDRQQVAIDEQQEIIARQQTMKHRLLKITSEAGKHLREWVTGRSGPKH